MLHDLKQLDATLYPEQKAELMAKWANDARLAAQRKERAEKEARERTTIKLTTAFTEHVQALERIEAGASGLYTSMAGTVETGRTVAELLAGHPDKAYIYTASCDDVIAWVSQLINGVETVSLAEKARRINSAFLAEHVAGG